MARSQSSFHVSQRLICFDTPAKCHEVTSNAKRRGRKEHLEVMDEAPDEAPEEQEAPK